MSTDLGRKIQLLRLQSKDSQEVMAQKLNISRQAISKWENNVSAPDVAMLSKIANYYDVEITYFTNDENSNDSSKKQMKSLFILNTHIYRFVLGFVSVLTLLFFSVFSLLLTIPLFYINLTRKKYGWTVFYFALVLLGFYILMTILFPGLMPYNLDVRMDWLKSYDNRNISAYQSHVIDMRNDSYCIMKTIDWLTKKPIN